MREGLGKRSVLPYFVLLFALVFLNSVLFHALMVWEEREFSWVTGLYWTLTVMSTLGFGDITFHSDVGRVFSILVLLEGLIFLIVLLPVVVVRFLYLPWLEVQSKSKVWASVPIGLNGHVVIVGWDPLGGSLVRRLKASGVPYCILLSDVSTCLTLRDQGWEAYCGEWDRLETYRRLGVDRAAMVVVLTDDVTSTSVIFSVREVSPSVSVVVNANHPDSVDILSLAGATHVFEFTKDLGELLARRIVGYGGALMEVCRFGSLLLVEIPARVTGLVGRTLEESGFQVTTGLMVVGTWQRGVFELPLSANVLDQDEFLLGVGEEGLVKSYVEGLGVSSEAGSVLIIGGGRVGLAASRALTRRGVSHVVVERGEVPPELEGRVVRGSAAEVGVLRDAGFFSAHTVLVTTHTDDLNVYLTLYCRKLRPDVWIVGRSTRERNVGTLYRAGADLVLSYASLGASSVFNLLFEEDFLLLSEGLCIRYIQIPELFSGRCLRDTPVFRQVGLHVLGVERQGLVCPTPGSSWVWQLGDRAVVIGMVGAHDRLFAHPLFCSQPRFGFGGPISPCQVGRGGFS